MDTKKEGKKEHKKEHQAKSLEKSVIDIIEEMVHYIDEQDSKEEKNDYSITSG